MTRVTVLPHDPLCPEGKTLEVDPGTSLCDALLAHSVELEHACDRSCACTTCHVIVTEGLHSLEPAAEREEDLLDRAWGLTAQSRLACQAKVSTTPLVIEIPRYTINHARENH
jgi:ferredoxin, 2Fe-2S